jgi:hypothetical protein
MVHVYHSTGTGSYIPEFCNLGLGLVYLLTRSIQQVRYLPEQFLFTSVWGLKE